MLIVSIQRDEKGHPQHIETALAGQRLLNSPRLNKGSAFSQQERRDFNLLGLLPQRVESLSQQVARMYQQYQEKPEDLQKNIFLNGLHDTNEVLFYSLVQRHLKEMLPIIYTPTVGDAVERFSLEMRRPRGLYLSYETRDEMDDIFRNRALANIDLVVVSDGEGVLGIGDQGIGGMDICIAKLMVYTLCAGIDPNRVLPIQLDVGTNNEKLLTDPMYLGWRHKRISGKKYDAFIDQFVGTLYRHLPDVYLHWEDFGRDNARRNLERYRNKVCTFNDDMQGTGMVTLANVMAGVNAVGSDMTQQRFVIMGAGTAGVGIADQLYDAVVRAGLSPEAARDCFYLIDRDGLLVDSMKKVPDFQKPYLRRTKELQGWQCDKKGKYLLADVVRNVKPTILIGCSTVKGAFTEAIVKEMAAHVKHPIIMPLSNPTSHAEATPKDLIEWTQGKALVATGSPFEPVKYGNKMIRISQGNNAFIFPGLGLGVIISKAKRVTDGMLCAASEALSACSPSRKDRQAPLLADLDDVQQVSRKVAKAVAKMAIKEGVAGIMPDANLDQLLREHRWEAKYLPYKRLP